MANLGVSSQQPERIVLGKGGKGGVGSLVGLIIFAVVACAGLGALLDGGELNPVMVVVALIVGFSLLSAVWNALYGVRVEIDGNQKIASRTESIFFFPVKREELAFNTLRDVQLNTARGATRMLNTSLPIWQVELAAADGSRLLVNDRGTRLEMQALADQVAAITRRPVRDATASDSANAQDAPTPRQTSPNAPYARASARQRKNQVVANAPVNMTSARMSLQQLIANASVLGTSARMAGEQETANAPVLATSARMASAQTTADASVRETSARMANDQLTANAPVLDASFRMAGNQLTANAPVLDTSFRMAGDQFGAMMPSLGISMFMASAQANAFESDAAIRAQMNAAKTAAGVPFDEASARLAARQAQAESEMGYTMPPLLTLPQMPALMSFAPAMDLPALAPMDSVVLMETFAPAQITKDVTAETFAAPELMSETETETPDNAATEYRAARQLYRARKFTEARAAYERALDYDPSNTQMHNDLGVLLYDLNKITEAERAFRHAIALDAFYAPGRYNLGLTLRRLGNRKQALEQFRLGAQTAPREWVSDFQDALQDNVHGPILSST